MMTTVAPHGTLAAMATITSRRRFGLLLALAAVLGAGCGDMEDDGLTTCRELCVGETGALETCDVRYDFAALTAALEARPDLVEQLGFREVTSCRRAASVSRVLID
jgi:hypothetical protein